MMNYEIDPINPKAHQFRVKLQVKNPSKKGEIFYMPAWLPGSYLIRDFSKHILSIRAYDTHHPEKALPLIKLDSHTFQCQTAVESLTLEYVLYAWDRSVRGAHLDLTHGFFNGSALCLCPLSQAKSPAQIKLLPPKETYQNKKWSVATGMKGVNLDKDGFGIYEALDYESLIDYPFEMGAFVRESFEVRGIGHTIALTGLHDGDLNRLKMDVANICESYAQLFEGLPFDDYHFLLTVLEEGYGGLEHRNSSALMCQKKCLPPKNLKTMTKDYRNLLGLFSHEYCHAWLVKRIKPQEFYDMDLRKPAYTHLLWAFEGITSYYDDLMLLRSGCIPVEAYLEALTETMNRVFQGLGRFKQTLKESSFDAWTKFYQPNENSPNSVISYYTKGALCALLCDLHIRMVSNQTHSLDDVMKKLWTLYGRTSVGLSDQDLERLLIEFGTESIKPLLDLCLNTTEELPLKESLQAFGVTLSFDYSEASSSLVGEIPASMGMTVTGNELLTIQYVIEDSAAMKAGLSAQDVLVAFDNSRVTANNYQTLLLRKKPLEKINVHVFREERLLSFDVTLQEAQKNQAKLVLMDLLNDSQKSLRLGWLGQ